MQLSQLIEEKEYSVFLIDASGVLYTHKGQIAGITETVQALQRIGQVYVVTNNSYLYPNAISEKLRGELSLDIKPDYIISSGEGLAFDDEIRTVLQQSKVYVMGSDQSLPYVLDVADIHICEKLNDATAIVLTAYIDALHREQFERLKDFVAGKPNVPIICCNPDQMVVKGDQSFYKVVGYYAKELEQLSAKPVLWFGKPYENFSKLVQSRLTQHGHDAIDAIFFDDNVYNVKQLSSDLSCLGCWVKDTGIHYDKESDLTQISALSLKSHVYNLE